MQTSSLTQSSYVFSPTQLMEIPEKRDLIHVLKEFAATLARFGIQVSVTSEKSLLKLS